MKITKTILSAVFLLGAMGPSVSSAAAAANVVSKDAFTEAVTWSISTIGSRDELH